MGESSSELYTAPYFKTYISYIGTETAKNTVKERATKNEKWFLYIQI